MNYFNYFTEIEDTFVRRRGKHVYLSPIDWALIESWKEKGVPLHVALRGIEQAFDSFEAKPRRRSVKSLMYCQEEVEAQYAEWLDSQVGAGPEKMNGGRAGENADEEDMRLPFSRAAIAEHLTRAHEALMQVGNGRKDFQRSELREALMRSASRLHKLKEDFMKSARPNVEKLEASLTSLEKLLDEALEKSVSSDELTAARSEIEAQLQPYKSRMEPDTYNQTFNNLLLKRLRDQHGMPRLSLFYL